MGRRSAGQTGSAPLRPGRSGEAGGRDSPGRVGEERRAITWPTRAGEPTELPGRYPPLQRPIQAVWVLGASEGGRGDQERQERRTLPNWRSRRGEQGINPAHLSPGNLLSSQLRSPAL